MRRLYWGVLALVLVAGACGRGGDNERTVGKIGDDLETVSSSTSTPAATPPSVDPAEVQTDPNAEDFVPQLAPTPRPSARASSVPGPATEDSAPPPRRAPSPGFALPDPAPSSDNRWAVIVGISRYNKPTHPTVGGAGDAAVFRQVLLDAGWAADHIVVAVDKEATANNIRAAMDWLVAHSNPDSFSFFHYSGHVKQKGIGNEFLWGADNGFIPNHEFGSTMQGLQGWAWVDISGCEAAGFDVGISSSRRIFSGSSQVDEKSYEDPQVGMSMWTSLVADQGLRQSGDLTIQDALRYGQERAPDITAGQTPYGPQHPELRGPMDARWHLRSVPGSPHAATFDASPAPPPPPDSGGGAGGDDGTIGTAPAPKQCTTVAKLLGCKDG